jgi:microcin C transport system substrate-binding protein
MRNMILAAMLLVAAMVPAMAQQPQASVKTVGALSLVGEPKYKPGFDHFDFVNPNAPKGGTARLSVAPGSFDSLNPWIVAGTPPMGIGLVYESLTQDSIGELSTAYGLIAESITVPSDRSWVEYVLNPKARWHDGKPITPDDVIFSFNTLIKDGKPFWAQYYHNVKKAEKTGQLKVKFTFDQKGNRELPMIMGQLPILPKHYWEKRDFTKPSLDVPLGSGPYKVADVKPGRSITYERVKDYWGKDLPVNKGFHNFDRISYEYFGDETVEREALKAGKVDFLSENNAKDWATQYTPEAFPAIKAKLAKKEEIAHKLPTGMQAFVFNIRRDVFRDPRVRQALGYALDFEWSNKNLFYGQYTRTESFFSNSDLASTGLPSPAELALLDPLKGKIPAAVFTAPFKAPATDGTGNNRDNLRKAAILLQQAGYEIRGRNLVNKQSGKPLTFEILNVQPAFERIIQPYVENLKKLGVQANIRTVDPAQYEERMKDFEYDMTVESFAQSDSPGNEQREFWGSDAAKRKGSRNVIGIADPAVDTLIDKVIYAPDRDGLIAATRALDRVLLNSYYVVPMWHLRYFRVAYWDKFGRPAKLPDYSYGFPSIWWLDPQKDAALKVKAPK